MREWITAQEEAGMRRRHQSAPIWPTWDFDLDACELWGGCEQQSNKKKKSKKSRFAFELYEHAPDLTES
jgi:hypothetical protein